MKKAFPAIILVIASSFLIFYRFALIPKYLAFDEVEFTKLALSLDGKPYTPYSPLATGHSTLYFYIILLSLKTFGVNVFALRLPAAIFGVLSVIIFYLIMKILNTKYFMLYTLILLTSRWFLNFSRFAFEPTFLLFLELTSIYFFLLSLETLKWQYLIFCGLFAGLTFNSYTPGRIFFLLPLFFLTLKTLRASKLYKLVYFIVPFLVIIASLTIHLSTIKDTRIDQLFFWRNHEMTIKQKVVGTLQNISSISLMFFAKGDMNGKHNYPGKPALNPILGGLFLIGLFYSLKNFKKDLNQFIIGYFLISLIPSIPIYPWENPSMLRTFTTIPSIVYFVGQGIIVILNWFQDLRFRNKFGMTIIIILVFFSSFYELRTYFKYQAKVFENSFEIKYPLEKAIKLKNPYEKIK